MKTGAHKKILLFNPPGKNIYLRDYYCSHTSKARYYWGPFDLIVLSGLLSPHFELAVIDAIAKKLSPRQALERVLASECDALIFLTGAVSWVEDFALLQELAAKSSKPITIIGNGDILFAKGDEFLSKYSFLNAVILNFTSTDVVDYLRGNEKEFSSLSYRKPDGTVIPATHNFPRTEFSLPLPRYDLFPYRTYRIPHGRRLPYAGFLTDYGCPFTCDYCIGGEIGFRFRDIDNAIEEMRYLRALGIKELWIKDLTFGAQKKRTLELLERMLREDFRFTWVCLSRPNVLALDLLHMMKRAGCHTIQLGVETASDELRSRYSKGVTREQVRRGIAMCKQVGIRVLAHYILGLPGDTEENINATIRFALELDTEFASFNVAMPRMGTRFRENALREGLINEDVTTLDNSVSFPVYDTKELSRERLWQLRNKAIRAYHLRPRFVLKRLLGVRSVYELESLFTEGLSLLATTMK
jgi:anaerobic magnesium-protoporphyrin IX monomethyl ester cyclase